MEIINSVSLFLNKRREIDGKPNVKIGLVPTMGALHEGHMSLVRQAKEENDLVICSLFVNPTQFDKAEDLEKYPRDLIKDAALLEQNGVDILFAPNADEVYGEPTFLKFNFGELEKVMEGQFRDGHFNGVATIVSKLFNYVRPSKAYFGQKDLQQVAVIKDLVKSLSFNLDVVRCPIVRDQYGLALSSRNERLSAEEKNIALILSETIFAVKDRICSGASVSDALKEGNELYQSKLGEKPEYLELVYADSLQSFDEVKTEKELAVCIAGYVGPVRLIDNVVFEL